MSNYTNVSSFSPSPLFYNVTDNSTNGSLPLEPSPSSSKNIPSPSSSEDTLSPSSSLENSTRTPSNVPDAAPSPEHGFVPSPSYATPSPSDEWIPSPSSVVSPKNPSSSTTGFFPSTSPSSIDTAHNTTPSFDPGPVLVIDEVVNWAVGTVFFGIIAMYCCIIFYPGKCAKMTRLMKTRHFVDFRPDMREREYGSIKDEVDEVELTASTYEETEHYQKETRVKTQREETMESMI